MKALAPDAGKILLSNVYGWFERREKGVYALTAAGQAALLRWPQHLIANPAGAGPAAPDVAESLPSGIE
jgi:hypothetical protein